MLIDQQHFCTISAKNREKVNDEILSKVSIQNSCIEAQSSRTDKKLLYLFFSSKRPLHLVSML